MPIDAGAMYPDLPRAQPTTSGVSGSAKPSWANSNNNPMWQPPQPKSEGRFAGVTKAPKTVETYRITSYWLNRKRSK